MSEWAGSTSAYANPRSSQGSAIRIPASSDGNHLRVNLLRDGVCGSLAVPFAIQPRLTQDYCPGGLGTRLARCLEPSF